MSFNSTIHSVFEYLFVYVQPTTKPNERHLKTTDQPIPTLKAGKFTV